MDGTGVVGPSLAFGRSGGGVPKNNLRIRHGRAHGILLFETGLILLKGGIIIQGPSNIYAAGLEPWVIN